MKDITTGHTSKRLAAAGTQTDENLPEIDALVRQLLQKETNGDEVLLQTETDRIIEELLAGLRQPGARIVVVSDATPLPPTGGPGAAPLMLGPGTPASPAPLVPAPIAPSREELAGGRLITLLGGDADLIDGALAFLERVQRFSFTKLDDALDRIEAFEPAAANSRQLNDLIISTKQLATRIKDGHETIQTSSTGAKYLRSVKEAQDSTAIVQRGFDELVRHVFTIPGGTVPTWSRDDQKEKIDAVEAWMTALSNDGNEFTTLLQNHSGISRGTDDVPTFVQNVVDKLGRGTSGTLNLSVVATALNLPRLATETEVEYKARVTKMLEEDKKTADKIVSNNGKRVVDGETPVRSIVAVIRARQQEANTAATMTGHMKAVKI